MRTSVAVLSLVFGLLGSNAAAQVQQQQAPMRQQQQAPMRQQQAPMRQQQAPMQGPPGTVPLYCRGGAMRSLGFQQYNATVSRITVLFNKGSRPARQGLNPGECSWADRAMGPTEAEAFCHDVSDVFVATNHIQDSRYNPPDFYMLQSFWSQSAPYLKSIRQPNYTFTVNVNPQGSCLTVVTR
jgi:hypothetical protein